MKPISEYTLQECLASIRRGDYLNRHQLADRINDLTRWIPVGERLPTEEDADDFGEVAVSWTDGALQIVSIDRIDPVCHTHWRRIDTP